MTDKLYSEIEGLISDLRDGAEQSIANIIDHRMHKVSWTTRSELLECIEKLLKEELEVRGAELDKLIVKRMRHILSMIAGET